MEITYPSYWKSNNEIYFFSVIKPGESVCVTVDRHISDYKIETYPAFEKISIIEDLTKISQLEFMKAYNKAHEEIEALVTSVGEVVKQ